MSAKKIKKEIRSSEISVQRRTRRDRLRNQDIRNDQSILYLRKRFISEVLSQRLDGMEDDRLELFGTRRRVHDKE